MTEPSADDMYQVGEITTSPWGHGLMTAATGGNRSSNPHPVESNDWNEWLRGFQSWEDAPKTTIEIPDGVI